MQNKGNFFINRFKSVKYAAKGFWILVTTENSIIVQVIISIIMTVLGFIMNLSATEWMFQIIAIALIALVGAVSADFMHYADLYDGMNAMGM